MTTSTIPAPARTGDATPGVRLLPGPTSPRWDDAETVFQLAAYADRVDPGAHLLAHPAGAAGCPYGDCPTLARPHRDPACETTWREDALVSPVPAEPAVTR